MTAGPRAALVALATLVAACGLSLQGTGDAPSSSSATGTGGAGGTGGELFGGGPNVGGASSSSSSAAAGGEAGAGGAGAVDCDAAGDLADPATGHCYHLFETGLIYAAADIQCGIWKLGGRFAAVSGQLEYDFLVSQLSDTDFWIGADDLDGNGSWAWVNGEMWGVAGWGTPDQFPWKSGEPGGGGGELCLRLKSLLFESKNCDEAKPFLCERQ